MSGTYPTVLAPASVIFRGWSPSFASTAHSLRRQVRSRGAHRWYMKLRYGPSYRAEWSPHVAFLDEQHGQTERFSVAIPGLGGPRGGVSGATQVNGNQAAGGLTVNLKNLPLNIVGVFKAHDLISFASHLKLYSVTRDANSDGAGLATVYINCPLMSALANNEAVTWQNVAMKAALIGDTVDREWKGGLICPGFEVEMIEDPY